LVAPQLVPGEQATALAAICFAIAGLSAYLAYLAAKGLASAPQTREYRLPPLWALGACLLIGLGGGALSLRSSWMPYTLPWFNLLALGAWAAILFALASARLKTITRREAAWHLTYGSFIATSLSGLLEIILLFSIGLFAVLVAALLPQSASWIQSLSSALESLMLAPGEVDLRALLLNPLVIAVLGGTLVIAVPLVEESLKTLGILAMIRRRPDRARCILWGVACGLGFGLIESLLNAASAGNAWLIIALVRMATMILHALTGGIMGLAWYSAFVEKRLLKTLALYIFCLGFHGLWNGAAVLLTLLSLQSLN
jgi:hypothetical protein